MIDGKATLIGIDIGGTHVRVAVAKDLQITSSHIATWPGNLSPMEEVSFVADLAMELVSKAGVVGQVSAAGVSLAAMLDRGGVVVNWPNKPGWRGLSFRSLLEARLGVPTAIEDDANSAALAERVYGAARSYDHVLVMVIGTGVGAGLILDGRLYLGRNGWAGELGHVVISPDGPECACGKRGCLQVMASGRAIDRIAIERGLNSTADVMEAAKRGEAWAEETLSASGRWLGLAAANVVNLLDLDAVVIGGALSGIDYPWWTTLEDTFRANLLNSSHRNVDLCKAVLRDKAGLMGAVALAGQLMSPVSAGTKRIYD